MNTKRVQISRASRWRITPFAVSLWGQILELLEGPRNRHGELASDADNCAVRDIWIALAAEIGASKFYHEPHRILDDQQPWPWVHDAGQLQNWEESRQIRDLLNAALLETARATAARRRAKRAQAEPQSEPKALRVRAPPANGRSAARQKAGPVISHDTHDTHRTITPTGVHALHASDFHLP